MRKIAFCSIVAAVGGLACALGADAPAKPADGRDATAATMSALAAPGALRAASFAGMHAMQADSMRLSGLAAATNFPAAANMTPAAAEEWGRMLAGGLDKESEGLPSLLAEDFLAGSTILMGPCDASGAVFAYWNPFWDMMLFVKTGGGELPEPRKDAGDGRKGDAVSASSLLGADTGSGTPDGKVTPDGKPPKTEQFVWVGGKAFRGEKEDAVATTTAKSFSETLWLREAGTVRRFREIYPETDGMAFSKGILRIDPRIAAIPRESTRAELRTAAYLRLKMIEACFTNNERKTKAFRGAEFLRKSSSDDLVKAFDSFKTRPFCRSFAMLDPALRKGFSLYGCYVGSGREPDAMLIFVNVEMPRLYATGFFPKGIIDKIDWPEYLIEFEWYDLDAAESLLKAVATETSERQEGNAPAADEGGVR